jgi:ATP-dependent DNA helicase RecG
LKQLITNKLNWNDPLKSLYGKRLTKSAESLIEAGFKTINDLIWLFPLRVQKAPEVSSFDNIQEDFMFRGKARVANIQGYPSFNGKGRARLFNITLIAQDILSEGRVSLKWFNTYPSLKQKLYELDEFEFMGKVSSFKGSLSIVNPQTFEIGGNTIEQDDFLIEYPTVNSINGNNVKKVIDKIPDYLWDSITEFLPTEVISKRSMIPFNDSVKAIHAKTDKNEWSSEKLEIAKKRIIYEEFLQDQIKIIVRRKFIKEKLAPILSSNEKNIKSYLEIFPYTFTKDQLSSLDEVKEDFISKRPMMRLIQGDVGCGKTSVAIVSALIACESGQVAIMCPTEALATQHLKTFKELINNKNIEILLGSTKPKDKKAIYERLVSGEIDIIIGTHSLFQDAVEFKDLVFAIIDEQHKFGVNQRLRLINKGEGVHSLLMSATPIPRTLSLTQYGDLEISTIKTIPMGRKGIQTRIITSETLNKYLSFIKTRISIGEQVYVVVPAIEESEALDLKNVNSMYEYYTNLFPNINISKLHGKLKSEEKALELENFNNGQTELLISTSVIEVGINVLNATVMAIHNPNRFGLSSLHQLRGRVGRGEKPGFCFLVNTEQITPESLKRLSVIENSHDGFKIAEADLEFRGEGDLFGANQSGIYSSKKFANLITHREIFEQVIEDVKLLETKHIDVLMPFITRYEDDLKITSTI